MRGRSTPPGSAEDLLDGGPLVADEAVSADHRERVRRVMHQRAEALLALSRSLLCRLAFVDFLDQAPVRMGERPVGPPPQRQGEGQRDGQDGAAGTDQHPLEIGAGAQRVIDGTEEGDLADVVELFGAPVRDPPAQSCLAARTRM